MEVDKDLFQTLLVVPHQFWEVLLGQYSQNDRQNIQNQRKAGEVLTLLTFSNQDQQVLQEPLFDEIMHYMLHLVQEQKALQDCLARLELILGQTLAEEVFLRGENDFDSELLHVIGEEQFIEDL